MNRRDILKMLAASATIAAGLKPTWEWVAPRVAHAVPTISIMKSGTIHITSQTRITVLELHRYLQNLCDKKEAQGEDILDITDPNPSLRMTNHYIQIEEPYSIDHESMKRLKNGTIDQKVDGVRELWTEL